MANIFLSLNSFSNPQTCLLFICANETFISIYGVVFTIVISLGVYIYGLQDKSEKITLLKNTDIKKIIIECLGFFATSFVFFTSPFYELVNFVLVAILIFHIYLAFLEIFKFNENELSGERAVKKFKEGVIQDKLKEFENLKIKNDAFQKFLEEKDESKEVERFLFDENNDSYYFIRAQSSGYITNIDLSVLFTKEIDQNSSKKNSYYIPYNVSNGASIEFDEVILGIKKEDDKNIDEEKLRSYVSISEEYENPSSYIEAEVRSYYSAMFSLIKIGDDKGLDLKLKEFSSFVDHFTNNTESYIDIVQFISDDIIFQLQKYAFKQGDVDCIRTVVSFSLGYVYQSIDKKSIKIFNIFLRNFTHAFYASFKLSADKQEEFYDIYFRWLNEVTKYSIKSRIQKDKDYIEFATNFLSSINGILKLAFDNKNLAVFSKTLSFLNGSFCREDYEFDKMPLLDEIILTKKAVIFGFTAWVYKYYGERWRDEFYQNALNQLLNALQKDRTRHYADDFDELNYYLSLYSKAVKLSEEKSSFGWDSWGMPEGRVYTVTIRGDIQNLLVDRLLKILVENSDLIVSVKDKNYDDMLSHIKEGDRQFDPLIGKNQGSFIAASSLSDEQFISAKSRLYGVFLAIAEKYNNDVKTELIEQSLDEAKFNKFAEENFDSYEKARVLYRIHKFVKEDIKRKEGFGYNILLNKEQFVEKTNVHYTNGNQFGEDLARSEDNKILQTMYKKFEEIPSVKKDKIAQIISDENNLSAIVLWINGYFNIEDTNPKNFKPSWQEQNSKEINGHYYQGSISGVPVYIVYKFQEHKVYPDTLFLLKDNAFSVKEFEIENDEVTDMANIKITENPQNCLNLSIVNLSNLEQERTKIVEKWIEDGTAKAKDKKKKIEDLKTSVVFKFFKGLQDSDILIDKSNIKIFRIK